MLATAILLLSNLDLPSRMVPMRYWVLALICLLCYGMSWAKDIAIITNKGNATSELSLRELIKIFEQEWQNWESGKKIYLILQETGSPEKQIVLRKIYRKANDDDLKKFWLGKIFRGEIATFPKTLSSNEAVKRFVSQAVNAIGFIDSAFVDDSIKVLRIDGKFPGERGYVLPDGAAE
jgi:ABC-type phosphate transport system substrate-binding protein